MNNILEQANKVIQEEKTKDRKQYARVNFEMTFAFSGLALIAKSDGFEAIQTVKKIAKTYCDRFTEIGYVVDSKAVINHIIHLHAKTVSNPDISIKKFEKNIETYFDSEIWDQSVKWEE